MLEKAMLMQAPGGNEMPPDDPGDGMLLPPGEEGMRIFEDKIIWYKFFL
jgi:hypothetical protein